VAGADADSVSHGDETLTAEDPKRITTAVFYSITSTQRGFDRLVVIRTGTGTVFDLGVG